MLGLTRLPTQREGKIRQSSISLRYFRWSAILLMVGGLALTGSIALRASRTETQISLGSGVTYQRRVEKRQRPIVAHLVWIDMKDPQIRLFVTPEEYRGKHNFAAMTVQECVDHYDLLVAVNGDYFEPWHNSSPFTYYPRSGDPVAVQGPSAWSGTLKVPEKLGYFARRGATVYFSRTGKVSFEEPLPHLEHAISGGPLLVRAGKIADFPPSKPHPQTAVGYNSQTKELLLLVIDGRQPGYSEGLDNHELAAMMLDLGCDWALRLDGGGSSTMAAQIQDRTNRSKSKVLNTPVHSGIPGLQRPVANHLGVYLR